MNILITGAWQNAKDHMKKIEEMGHNIRFLQYEKDELPCPAEWVEGVICNGLFLYHQINQFVNLKYIQLTSAGYDRVPMDYIKDHNISIYNARGVYSIPMAEHAVMGILELYRKANLYHEYQKEKVWKKERDLVEIDGKKVLIVGCGSVGTECAKRLKAFGAYVIGIDVYIAESEYFENIYPIESLNEQLHSADIVLLTVPLTKETFHLMDKERLSLMKDTAVLVNISRGKVIDENALVSALTDHSIHGAFLDVFEDEPLDECSSLWNLDNVILTPHISFIGDGNLERLLRCILNSCENTE